MCACVRLSYRAVPTHSGASIFQKCATTNERALCACVWVHVSDECVRVWVRSVCASFVALVSVEICLAVRVCWWFLINILPVIEIYRFFRLSTAKHSHTYGVFYTLILSAYTNEQTLCATIRQRTPFNCFPLHFHGVDIFFLSFRFSFRFYENGKKYRFPNSWSK